MKQIVGIILIVFGLNANAQVEKGKFLMGGSTNLGFNSISSSQGGANTGALDVDLSMGYLITKGLGVGIDANYVMVKNDQTSTSIGAGLFVRYYIKGFYPEVKVGVTSSESGGDPFRSNYFGGGIGYAIMLNDFVSLDPKVNYIKQVYDGGDTANFGIRIALNIYL